jgi:hypothetical protein
MWQLVEVIVEKLGKTAALAVQSLETWSGGLPSALDHQDQEWLHQRAAMLSACYRKDEANNPEMYGAALQAVLGEYPPDVVEFVTDPRTGIAARLKWLPSIAEVHEACREHGAELEARNKRADALKKQFAERDEYEAGLLARKNNPTMSEIEKNLGRGILRARLGNIRGPLG